MLGGVEGGRIGVAVDDRLVDHAVLGRVQARAPGHRHRLVAQALPQRLVHHRGDVVGEGDEHRVVGHDGDLAVEEAVALVPVRAVGAVRGAVHAREQLLGVGVGAAVARRQRRDARLEQRARLEQCAGAGVVRRRRHAVARGDLDALDRVGGHERARARARLDHAVDLERGDRLAHRGAPDLQALGQVALGGQPLAGLQQPHPDLAGDPIGDPLVELGGPQRA